MTPTHTHTRCLVPSDLPDAFGSSSSAVTSEPPTIDFAQLLSPLVAPLIVVGVIFIVVVRSIEHFIFKGQLTPHFNLFPKHPVSLFNLHQSAQLCWCVWTSCCIFPGFLVLSPIVSSVSSYIIGTFQGNFPETFQTFAILFRVDSGKNKVSKFEVERAKISFCRSRISKKSCKISQ